MYCNRHIVCNNVLQTNTLFAMYKPLQTNKPGHHQVENGLTLQPMTPLVRPHHGEENHHRVVEPSLAVNHPPSEYYPVSLLKSHSECLAGLCPLGLLPVYKQGWFVCFSSVDEQF